MVVTQEDSKMHFMLVL